MSKISRRVDSMSNRTEFRLVDILPTAIRGRQIVQVQVVRGDPRVGMRLESPEALGLWEITGFGTAPSASAVAVPPSMNLSVCGLEQGSELRVGMRLVEAGE